MNKEKTSEIKKYLKTQLTEFLSNNFKTNPYSQDDYRNLLVNLEHLTNAEINLLIKWCTETKECNSQKRLPFEYDSTIENLVNALVSMNPKERYFYMKRFSELNLNMFDLVFNHAFDLLRTTDSLANSEMFSDRQTSKAYQMATNSHLWHEDVYSKLYFTKPLDTFKLILRICERMGKLSLLNKREYNYSTTVAITVLLYSSLDKNLYSELPAILHEYNTNTSCIRYLDWKFCSDLPDKEIEKYTSYFDIDFQSTYLRCKEANYNMSYILDQHMLSSNYESTLVKCLKEGVDFEPVYRLQEIFTNHCRNCYKYSKWISQILSVDEIISLTDYTYSYLKQSFNINKYVLEKLYPKLKSRLDTLECNDYYNVNCYILFLVELEFLTGRDLTAFYELAPTTLFIEVSCKHLNQIIKCILFDIDITPYFYLGLTEAEITSILQELSGENKLTSVKTQYKDTWFYPYLTYK